MKAAATVLGEILPTAPWWPQEGAPKPATLDEAQANLKRADVAGVSPNDGRRRRAADLVRELEATNGVPDWARPAPVEVSA
jgi:hypothetical protein